MLEKITTITTEFMAGDSGDQWVITMTDNYISGVGFNANNCPKAFNILVFALNNHSEFDELINKMREVHDDN